MKQLRPFLFTLVASIAVSGVAPHTVPLSAAETITEPIAHRGLLLHAPENTLTNFAACLNLQVGFEFDVRRSKDGTLICLHDETVDRTTDGKGRATDLTLLQLTTLDAGSWFSRQFTGQRIPTIDNVLALIAAHPQALVTCAVDIKAEDAAVELDMIRLAQKHQVLNKLLFIGRTIDTAEVRRRLRAVAPKCQTAALASTRDELRQAITDPDSDWVYIRFLPKREETDSVHIANKRIILSGPLVSGNQTDAWTRGVAAGVDLILTDYPLEFRQQFSRRATK